MIRWQRIKKGEGKKTQTQIKHFSIVYSLLWRRLVLGPNAPWGVGGGSCLWASPQAEPAPRDTREPQQLQLDAEDPSAWRCPREGRECPIRAGAAPSPRHAPQGDQGPARRDGCGKAGLWLLYPIDSGHVQEPKPLLVRKLHPEKKLLVTSLPPPR